MKRCLPVVFFIFLCFSATAERALISDTFDFVGEWVWNSGDWTLRGGGLAQIDGEETIATASRIVRQRGVVLYEFDLWYLSGLSDGYGGLGLHILIDEPTGVRSWGQNDSYLLWIAYDIEAYGTDHLYAQMYKSSGPVSMTYHNMEGSDFPLDKAIFAAGDLAETTRENPLRVRLLIDTDSGNGRLYRPGGNGSYFTVDFGSSLGEGMYIGLRTNSLSVVFDNVTVSIID